VAFGRSSWGEGFGPVLWVPWRRSKNGRQIFALEVTGWCGPVRPAERVPYTDDVGLGLRSRCAENKGVFAILVLGPVVGTAADFRPSGAACYVANSRSKREHAIARKRRTGSIACPRSGEIRRGQAPVCKALLPSMKASNPPTTRRAIAEVADMRPNRSWNPLCVPQILRTGNRCPGHSIFDAA